jgi:hypothetical protein
MVMILLRKYNFELYMTATELTESTERGVWGGKSISVFSGSLWQKVTKNRYSLVEIENLRSGLSKNVT